MCFLTTIGVITVLYIRVSDHANSCDRKAKALSNNSLPNSVTSPFLHSFLPEAGRRCQVRGHKACGNSLLQTCKFLFTGWEFSLHFCMKCKFTPVSVSFHLLESTVWVRNNLEFWILRNRIRSLPLEMLVWRVVNASNFTFTVLWSNLCAHASVWVCAVYVFIFICVCICLCLCINIKGACTCFVGECVHVCVSVIAVVNLHSWLSRQLEHKGTRLNTHDSAYNICQLGLSIFTHRTLEITSRRNAQRIKLQTKSVLIKPDEYPVFTIW